MPTTIIVRTPPGYEAERRYILGVVLGRWWGLAWEHIAEQRSDVHLERAERPDDGAVSLPDVLFATPPERWLTPASLPDPGHSTVPLGVDGDGALAPDEHLPVLYGPPGEPARLVEASPAGARVHLDVFGSAFFMLTRYEEIALDARGAYNRFPAASSVAQRDGFLTSPIVDIYVEVLWAACSRVWPGLRRRSSAFAVRLTHDVDDPLATVGRQPRQLARELGGDLVRRREPRLAVRRARAVVDARRGDHTRDPHNTFDFLMDVSERHGLRSAFYFLPHHETDPDAPEILFDHPWVQDLIGRVHRRGHEVGLHTAFGTYLDPERTKGQFARLLELAERAGVEQSSWGGRQHYLQWANPTTWRNWSTAGLDYDCTLAYSEMIGFRTGTGRDYRVFDLLDRQPLSLVEQPFQVMDVTLVHHMGLDPHAGREAALGIARECRRFGGTLGVLWHNDSMLRTTREKRWYEALIEDVTAP